jgi:metallophosphoesterase
MDEYLIETWNNTVSPDDDVYNLGDLSFAHDIKKIAAVLSRLNGKHHLIYGNHDDIIRRHNKYLFETVKHDGHPLLSSARTYRKLELDEIDNTLILFHYPINEWDGCHRGWYHLYGHLHDRVAAIKGRALNVGFDLHGRFLTAQDVDKFLCDLPKISYFGEAGLKVNSLEEAAELVSRKLAQLNQV